MSRHNRGISLAIVALFYAVVLGAASQASAHDNDQNGYYDRDGNYHHYGYYHHHRGYWNQHDGVRFWINVG